MIAADRRVRVDLSDPYWSRLLLPRFRYEPEIENVLRALTSLKPAFVDGGANHGYWSVLLSSRQFEFEPIIAVEASASAAEKLVDNLNLNALKHEVIVVALTGASYQTVSLDAGQNHSGTHVSTAGPTPSDTRETVTTITLDDLVGERPNLVDRQLIIKLDIEGQEIPAFVGAQRLLTDADVTFIYEDHGKDLSCAVTAWLFENSDRKIFLLDGAHLHPISSVSRLVEFKKNAAVGYNLLAISPSGAAAATLGVGRRDEEAA